MPDGSRSSSEQDVQKGAASSDEKFVEQHHEVAVQKAEHDIESAIASHMLNDPLMDPALIEQAKNALGTHDEKAELRLEEVLEDNSIYPEVRAAVSNIDDPTMPVNTWRAWFLGIISSVFLAGINQYFIFSTPIITITQVVVQLLAFPVGKALARIPYPEHWPYHHIVKPGPFNIKEHTLIVIMASVSYGSAYATDVIAAQKVYYHMAVPIGYQILLVLSTQMIGFSLAGLARKFLIWPAAMVWPSTLPVTALMNSMHKVQEQTGGWSRWKMFLVVFGCIFAWEFVPAYLFTGLSYFSWPTWIAPENVGVNIVFGGSGGLGLAFISLDWSVITSYLLSPMMVPAFAACNVFAGYAIIICIVAPILFAANVDYGAYLPFVSSGTYDRFGNPYNSTHILNSNFQFDQEAFDGYSRQYLPSTFMVAYGFGFAAITAALTHVGFFYGPSLVKQFRRSLKDEPDVHARLMTRYREVPHLWYGVLFVISFVLGIPAIVSYDTGLPVWAYILSLIIAFVYTVPIGIIQAITAQQIGLNVITEMIIGYMLPGRPVAMMIFKTFGYITMAQAMSFISDMKLGHYMKIPPRTMFTCQVIAQLISCFVQVGITNLVFGISGICTKACVIPRFARCAYQHTFYSASIIWSLIGPSKNFGAGSMYQWINICFLVGAIIPIPTYFLVRRFPKSFVRYVNWPLIFTGIGYFPPATGSNYTSWFLISVLTQILWRRYRPGQWMRYNYVISAALDAGTAISLLIITLALQFPQTPALDNVFNSEVDGKMWWGNTVEGNTMQGGDGITILTVPDQGFAPDPLGRWSDSPFA